jgi:hypothetical protein
MKITTAHRSGAQRGRARRTGQTVAALASGALLLAACSHSWRLCRAWPQRAGVLAAAAGIVLLAAACGGSSSSTGAGSGGSPTSAGSGGSSDGGVATESQQLAYAQCMRSHGVADFPDPNPSGGFGGRTRGVQSNPHYGTAHSACSHLLPGGGNGNKAQQDISQFLRHAQCMRSHGVPKSPDPQPGVNPRTALEQAGIDMNSPQFQAASRTCDRLLPPRSASPAQGGTS